MGGTVVVASGRIVCVVNVPPMFPPPRPTVIRADAVRWEMPEAATATAMVRAITVLKLPRYIQWCVVRHFLRSTLSVLCITCAVHTRVYNVSSLGTRPHTLTHSLTNSRCFCPVVINLLCAPLSYLSPLFFRVWAVRAIGLQTL